MLTVSSDPVHNDMIGKIKLKNRKLKTDGPKYTISNIPKGKRRNNILILKVVKRRFKS